MSCHFSCPTSACTTSAFNSCTSCSSGSSLLSGACFCTSPWDSSCTLISTLKPFFQGLDSFYLCLFPLVILLFCLKVKVPLSYRIIVSLQSFSMLVFSSQFYLYFEAFFGLTTLYKSNGYYPFGINRFQSISTYYALPAIILFCSILTALVVLYYPFKTFVKKYESFNSYLEDNWYHFFICFYFFSARSMIYYIGLWFSTLSMAISDIITMSIFALVIAVTILKTIYDFHKKQIDNGVYEQQIYLYVILSPLSIFGLPLVSSSLLYMLIYLSPIGLLFLILLLNRNYQIFTKAKVCFYLVQAVMPAFVVLFIVLSDSIKGLIVLITLGVSVIIIIVELSIIYYSGVSLERNSKVHPENQELQSVKSEDEPNTTNKNRATKKVGKLYF